MNLVFFKSLSILGSTMGSLGDVHRLLGLVTAAIASVIGTIAAWLVLTEVMRADFVFLPQAVLTTALLATAITVGFGFAGTASFYVMPNLAVGGTIGYNSYGTNEDIDPNGDVSQSIWEFSAHGKYMFTPGPIAPYAKATAGVFRYSAEAFGVSASSSEIGVGGGLGAQIRLPSSNVGFFAEGMMYNVFTEGSSTNFVGVRGGVNYYITPAP